MEKRDLVLGAVENYGWEIIRPFVESLRATGFDGEVRLFASNLDKETIAHMQAAGIDLSFPRRISVKVGRRRVRPFNARLRWPGQRHLPFVLAQASRMASEPRQALARFLGGVSNVDVARFFWAWSYLSRAVSAYRNVMLTDVRDVVFLRNPFEFPIADNLCCFLEDEHAQLGTQPNNRGWLAAAYGPGAVASLGALPISCSGVTIGTSSAVLEYLTVMVDELARLHRQPSGIDQGVHNYLLHTGRLANVRLLASGNGPVLTIGIMAKTDAAELVHARIGDANVIHQYDRHPELTETLAPFLQGRLGDIVRR